MFTEASMNKAQLSVRFWAWATEFTQEKPTSTKHFNFVSNISKKTPHFIVS